VVVDYRKQDVWSIGVILHQLIYGRKPTPESIDALLADYDDRVSKAQSTPLLQRQQQQQQQRHQSEHRTDDDDGWTTTALNVLLCRLLQPRASERFSASFALLFVRFTLFGPKQRPMWRSHEHWVAWLRERRCQRPHPFYGECMARGGTTLKKTAIATATATAAAGLIDANGGRPGDDDGAGGGVSDDYVPRYLEWQHTQFVWSATPADLLEVVSLFELSCA
jgi:hypothetical protein